MLKSEQSEYEQDSQNTFKKHPKDLRIKKSQKAILMRFSQILSTK